MIRRLRSAFAYIVAAGAIGMVAAAPLRAATATLFDGRSVAAIVHEEDRPLALAAGMLAGDLEHVTGVRPRTATNLDDCGTICVVVAKTGSPLLNAVMRDSALDVAPLAGAWERYVRVLLPSRAHRGRRYLVIAGSDTRGAIWGAVDLTREMGVSAWEWWADVAPRRVNRVSVNGALRLSRSPSVRYRGIFLNDEDWGLQPWAAKTFEPEVGDIGPKTYARIFELLWRLKANLIWPAMHDSTRPFYQIPGNAEAARDHAIVVGTSHAEPMMRNNVREWDDAARGPFNFFTNRAEMTRYWRERADAVKSFENVYSVGLRGKHDSGMEGAATPEIARDAMAQAIGVQRGILAETQGMAADRVPQALTLYKEVLDLYGLGLKVPDDVTLVWPEDNYGYVNQLPTPEERARSGGSGLYYHISYWGRPHDYLWLATTHPALIREQLDRAWETGARRLWVVNVGDIKPGEYLTQYFLDAAFDHDQLASTAADHLWRWAAAQFGQAHAVAAAGILDDYYDLAFERRPEFMGFSQVEPITPIRIGDYVRSGGAEAERRIDAYAALAARAEALAATIPSDRRDAFFQLVLYPVRGAANLNARNLKLDLAALATRQGRPVANLLADEARAAHAAIVADTAAYNSQAGGKWRGIMSMAPRGLPVFAEPPYSQASFRMQAGCTVDESGLSFVAGRPASHSLTIFSRGDEQPWSLEGQKGLAVASASGRLEPANGFQQRLLLRYAGGASIGGGTIRCGGKTFPITARLIPAAGPQAPVELDRTISIAASEAAAASPDWERIEGLGSRGSAMRARLTLASRTRPVGAAPLLYAFDTSGASDAALRIVALPVHPLTAANGLRIALQFDDGPIQLLDFETHGRSDEWKSNVLSNSAVRTVMLPRLSAGHHSVRVFALDPGFLLDRLDVRLDGAPDLYGAPLTR